MSGWLRLGRTLLLGAALAGLLSGCEREPQTPKQQTRATTRAAKPRPTYRIPPGLEDEHPDVVVFLRQFMETALANDYAGYRRLVSRAADPESRARFEKVLGALETLTVEAIEPIELPQLAGPAYRVISHVRLDPERKLALRRNDESRIAILVFTEEGELRMVFAPAELQPQPMSQPTDETQPTTTAPDYPWQSGADY